MAGQAQVCTNGFRGPSRHVFDGLSHRSLLLDWLNRALIAGNLRQEALTLLLFDLDQFDDANRRQGYAAGDRLLQVVAEHLLSCARNDPAACPPPVGHDTLPRPEGVGSPAVRLTKPIEAPRSATSRLTDLDLFAGLDVQATPHVARLLDQRVRLLKGEALYRIGSRFHALFAIRTGSCKSVLLTRGGHEQVADYRMAGEIAGMEGIGTGAHECQVIALEDMEVCALEFDQVERLAQLSEPFRHNLHKLLSRECVRAQERMLVLGTMPAEQRLADVSDRPVATASGARLFGIRVRAANDPR